MKRKTRILFGLLCFVVVFLSCDSEDNDNQPSQYAMVWVSHYNTARRAPDYERVYAPSVYVSAQITGNPMPDVDYVQVADKVFNDPICFTQDFPFLHFYSEEQVFLDSISEPKFSPLNISIHSNIGTISGSIHIPDTLQTLTIDAPDTIPLNASLTISWTGSQADFYLVEYYHSWSEEGGWLMYYESALTDSSSITFDSSLTSMDGWIEDIEVTPVNGTYPKVGAIPNMTGKGYGFLYVQNTGMSTDKIIVFGNGIDLSGYLMTSAKKQPKRDPSKAVFEKLNR
jgi:hypothetical protein